MNCSRCGTETEGTYNLGGILMAVCSRCDYLENQEREENWDDDQDDEIGFSDCPKCGRSYDEIDNEYQSCSKCGWDAENEKWGEAREPEDSDYLNGDADILTGRWY